MLDNPLQMNDWEIRKFLKLVLVIQLAMLGLLGLGAMGLDIPLLRQIVGFVYLAFVPGAIILRILKLHKLGAVQTLAYTVGLSLAFNMFLGFFINMLYPHIGISRPISTLPLIITWTVVLGILSFIAYKRDKDYTESVRINAGNLLSPPALLLCLLPPISVLGICLLNSQQTSAIPVQLLLLALVAIVVVLIGFGKFIPRELYPLAVFSLALSLLLHYSLATLELPGRDARAEYYMYSFVAANGVWNSAMPLDLYNAMLSVTVLPALFSRVLNLDGMWVFNTIWPLLYALVPLSLYQVYKGQIGDKNAFLATFYLITISVFYALITTLPRQEIGMLFFALMILVIVSKSISLLNRRVLLIAFALALVVSHYAVSYIFMLLCLAALLLLLFFLKAKDRMMTTTFVLLFIASTLGWYLYNTQSSVFSAFVHLAEHITTTFYAELLNFQSREVYFILGTELTGPLEYVDLGLLLLMQLFIAVGILKLIVEHRRRTGREEYTVFSLVGFLLLVVCIVVPFFSDTMGVERIYIIPLLFLAPFCISGGELALRLLWKVLNLGWEGAQLSLRRVSGKPTDLVNSPLTGTRRDSLSSRSGQSQIWHVIMSFLLIGLFLFASDFVYAVVDKPVEQPTLNASGEHLYPWLSQAEVDGGLWLLERMDNSSQVWSDDSGWDLFLAYRGFRFGHSFTLEEETLELKYPVPDDAYVYLRKFNINHRTIIALTETPVAYKRQVVKANVDELVSLDNRNMIYFNGGAVIYKDVKQGLK